MSGIDCAKIYLCIQALLVVSYLVFRGFRRFVSLCRVRVSYRYWIGIAQALIALAIVSPVVLHLIPSQNLPTPSWSVFRPVAEEIESVRSRRTLRVRHEKPTAPIQESVAHSGFSSASWTTWVSTSLPRLAWGFLSFAALGFLIFFTRLIRNLISLRAVLRRGTFIRRLGKINVVVSDQIAIPFSTRFSRCWIVLPTRILENVGDFRLAIRHELQHHRQGDTLWAIWIEILNCFFFPIPAIFFWKREIVELQEFSCDEALIGHKGISSHDYGSCLVRVAEAALGSRRMYAGTTCMATISKNPFYFKSFLRRRIEMFTKQQKLGTSKSAKWIGVLVGALASLMMLTFALGAEQSLRKDSGANGVQKDANPGTITVDPEIQEIAENALKNAIRSENAKSGFVIVADPNTGRILAVANVDTTRKRTGHWALGQVLEPASIAKTLVAAQAIESGLTSPEAKHSCENGSYRYGGRVYHDWNKEGWNELTTEETITHSSDICAIKIGEQVGEDGLRKMLVDYGFGPDGTAKNFPEARRGVLPLAKSKVYPDLVPAVSAGYGFLASPLELIQAYGAIANGGNLMKPELVTSENSQGEVIRRVLSADNAGKMREILKEVVLKGTAKGHASSDFYSTAGKTATSPR
jgi:beta-lactamase regulating signal transducer with metallopeptidase domain